MIGQFITDAEGNPLTSGGKKLADSKDNISAYQPPEEVRKLFQQVQTDYQVAWALQHRPFDEFDGISLLDRADRDQKVFAAYVGAEFVPVHKKWRWKGRKNTARNKLIGILSHMIAGMLFPYVYARNEKDEEDKMTARVMRILVEDHLKKAGYEMKFLYMVLSALVNPAVFVEVEYVEAIQRIKNRLKGGKIEVIEAVDDLLSGLNLNIVPIDELLLGDFYTSDIQKQPYVIRVRRISWDQARKIYQGKCFNEEGKDLFDYVEAGKTRVVLAGQENQTLFDIDWTEADNDFVQEINIKYRSEDLEVTFVGGVFMGNEKDVYNSNPFKHRRLSYLGGKWMSIPVVNIAVGGFEPIDPTGRFAYYKSGAFKEYWDDLGSVTMDRLMMDGTYLDVIKPMFISGIARADSVVIAPGAVAAMPKEATVTPYSLGPNLVAAINAMKERENAMGDSTLDKIMTGGAAPGVTAYATAKAEQNARVFLGVFGAMFANLIQKVGELAMDCEVAYTTIGELDASVPEALKIKFKTFLAKGKDKGKTVTNRIVLTDKYMGQNMTPADKTKREWELYNQSGGDGSDQRIYEINPPVFARHIFTMSVDPDQIVRKSVGLDKQEKILSFNMMSDPRVLPYTDPEAVVDDFVIDVFGGDDPDRYKRKGDMANAMLSSVMGSPGQPNAAQPAVPSPISKNTQPLVTG